MAISPYARRLAEHKGIDCTRLAGTGPGGRIVAKNVEAAAKGARPAALAPTAAPTPAASPAPAASQAEPMAVTLAAQYGVDLATVTGTGTGGRVTVADVLAARSEKPAPVKPSADEELPPLQVTEDEATVEDASFRLKTQARIVTASKHVIPHFYVTRAVDVTALLERKAEVKEKFGATVTHLIMRACVKAVQMHPEVNRSYDRGKVIVWKGIHIGVAVDTDDGLTVAVVRDAQNLTLQAIAQRTRELVDKARAGKLSATERRHPTLTLTNLGMFDVEHFQPIINPPSAITLAVASALEEPVVRDGAIRVGRVMRLTASCDHRIIQGVHAASFLRDLRAILEDPAALVAGD
ncbi:2-oxo acid dehydrogenase subunit E2 [bacterium]|nr:2-oxo acid dehydrogenase subunit E2 [bacterium]